MSKPEVNKFDLMRRNNDRLIKPTQLMGLSIGFCEEDNLSYPFFEYKGKIGTYVLKIERARSSLVSSTAATWN